MPARECPRALLDWRKKNGASGNLYIQGGAKVRLQLFIWKIIWYLENNNARTSSASRILTTANLLLPHPVTCVNIIYRVFWKVYSHVCFLTQIILLMRIRRQMLVMNTVVEEFFQTPVNQRAVLWQVFSQCFLFLLLRDLLPMVRSISLTGELVTHAGNRMLSVQRPHSFH